MNNNSLYKPPTADLKTTQELPENYSNSALSASRLKLFGWLFVFQLIMSITMAGFESVSGMIEALNPYENIIQILSLSGTFLWAFLMIMFRKFLNLRFDFYDVDLLINILIFISILIGTIPFASLDVEVIRGFKLEDLIVFPLFLPYGLVTFLTGKRLLTIADRFPYLKGFSWLSMVSGILSATIVLLVLSIPLYIVMDLFITLIFFEAARERREWQAAQ
jgi:hypothetical protein